MIDDESTTDELLEELKTERNRIAELEEILRGSDDPESMRIREDLGREQDLLRTLLENVPDYIYFKDRQRRFVRASNSFCRLFGCDMEQILGKTDEQLFPEQIAAQTTLDDRRVIEQGQPIINKEEGGEVTGDDEHWVLTTKLPWRDRQGNNIGLFGISRDITERRRAKAALKESELRLRSLIEQTSEAVFCYEFASPIPINLPVDEIVERMYDCALVDCNLVCAKAYGAQSTDEVLGRKLTDLFGTRPGSLNRLFRAVVEGGFRIVDGEAMEELPDGSHRHFLNNGHGVVEDGKLLRIWGNYRDVTTLRHEEEERRELEARLQRARRLESLGLLAGGIAHDFNNLLVGIYGSLDLALPDLQDASPLREHVETALTSARRAGDLINQLLAYAGKGKVSRIETDLNEIVRETVESLRPSIPEQVDVTFGADEGRCPIRADVSQVRQVVMNLVLNGVQAIGEQVGTVAVSTRSGSGLPPTLEPFRSEADPETEYVLLQVTDSGCGMDEHTRARMFDPFFTTKSTGRGLGLTTLHGVVRGHGGTIKVDSAPGDGTTVQVFLSSSEQVEVARQETEAGDDTWKREGTVLVADDDDTVRGVVREMLARLGLGTLEARDGDEAIEVFRAHRDEIVCVVLDLKMPRKGGEETLVALRGIRPVIPVLLSSGNAEEDALARFAGEAPSGFIQKPYSLSSFKKKLEEVLS